MPPTLPGQSNESAVPVSPSDRLPMSMPMQSSVSIQKPQTAAEYSRQQRMLREQRRDAGRLARAEAMAWQGRIPLRPTFNTLPMMTSRYRRPTIVIPVYVP